MGVKVGDSIPSIELSEKVDKKVDLSKELASGKGLIVFVPAAFSPGCTQTHIPGYIANPKLKNAGNVFVVSINDPFVMSAWAESLDPGAASGIRFVGDIYGELTKAWDLEFDSAAVFGINRSKRAAIVTENGKVTQVAIEPTNTQTDVSAAEKILV